jgi:hypothetical protein
MSSEDLIKRELYHQRESLERLGAIIGELRSDIEFQAGQGTIYYAVDFSELYAYLHFDEDEQQTFGVGLFKQELKKASRQHRLGLAHLFHTLAATVYLFPPYILEVWAYVRSQSTKTGFIQEVSTRALGWVGDLDTSTRELLSTLGDQNPLSERASKKLLDLVKAGNFEKLCVEVSEVKTWNERGAALKSLIEKKEISYSIDRLMEEMSIPRTKLEEPTRKEEERVFKSFPIHHQESKRFAKIIDARALLFLRNVNKLLTPHNTKIVLVTRDGAMRQAAKGLSGQEWFGWEGIAEHLRGIESIFLDLILRGTPSSDSKLEWIHETEQKLSEMTDSVGEIMDQMKQYGAAHPGLSSLGQAGEQILENTSSLWDQHINLQLSLAIPPTEWPQDSFLRISHGEWTEDEETGESQGYRDIEESLGLLQNLWNFVSTDEYRHMARKDAKSIWSEIDAECYRMIFLGHLGREGTERVIKVISETFEEPGRSVEARSKSTMLRSRSSLIMPPLKFVSRKYQDHLRRLQSWDQAEDKRLTKLQKAFYFIVIESTKGNIQPEDFLFMAFILGVLDLWEDSLEMAQRSKGIKGRIERSEVSYFLAFARRRVGMSLPNHHRAAQYFSEAYNDIQKARKVNPVDPRFMKEEAAIILLYLEILKRSGFETVLSKSDVNSKAPALDVTSEEARNLLKQALDLSQSDLRMKVEILNNLAYAEVLSDPPSVSEAESYLSQIDTVVANATKYGNYLLEGFGPHIADTRIMVRAKRALHEEDESLINDCINELSETLKNNELTESEKRIFTTHLEILREIRRSVKDYHLRGNS